MLTQSNAHHTPKFNSCVWLEQVTIRQMTELLFCGNHKVSFLCEGLRVVILVAAKNS